MERNHRQKRLPHGQHRSHAARAGQPHESLFGPRHHEPGRLSGIQVSELGSPERYQKRPERTRKTERTGRAAGKIDLNRIAVGGHSAGSGGALSIGGAVRVFNGYAPFVPGPASGGVSSLLSARADIRGILRHRLSQARLLVGSAPAPGAGRNRQWRTAAVTHPETAFLEANRPSAGGPASIECRRGGKYLTLHPRRGCLSRRLRTRRRLPGQGRASRQVPGLLRLADLRPRWLFWMLTSGESTWLTTGCKADSSDRPATT